ncbi:MAG TPA: MFS transporter [Candidatus Thermoplasmatota archaeon]|nr:MFS transporter [Candidatus Thermoplasmatota archaeon]
MRVARNVALLALASFLADVSGEMLMAVLPFLLVAQGAGGFAVGLVDGATNALGHLLKPLAGRVADATSRRKPLILGGYLVAALSRVGIALASVWHVSLLFRAADRVGKGLRTAPRDALLAESVPTAERGRAFGLHRAADTAGAVVGVALALAALSLLGASPATIVLAGAVIGLATALPLVLVREVDAHARERAARDEPGDPRFAPYVAIAALFALGQVSYMFFLLRAAGSASAAAAIALYLLFNVAYVVAAYPAGRLADSLGKPRLLLAGWLLFALACALMVPAPTTWLSIAAFAALGLGFAGFESVQRAFAADLAGGARRGARLGWFHAAVGLATVAGGVAAGLLWDGVGEWAAFAWGAGVAVAAAAALAIVRRA